MGVIHPGWYNRNEGIAYPVDETASLAGDNGALLPPDIIADLQLRFSLAYGRYAFLSSVSVTSRLVSLTIEAADLLDDPTTFQPLATVSVAGIEPHRHYALLPQAAGVGGWCVFGRGALDRLGYRGRFSSPRQALLTARAVRAYRPPPVRGIGDISAGSLLTGVVRLRAEPPLALSLEERDIGGRRVNAVVIRLVDERDTGPYAATQEGARLFGAGADSTFAQFAGPCGGRPESRSCAGAQPVEFVNSVAPDCDGTLTIELLGCARASQLSLGCGVAIDCGTGLPDTCLPPALPDDDGKLPGDVPPVIIPPATTTTTTTTPEPSESLSDAIGLPYLECFDDTEPPPDFLTESGSWAVVADDSELQALYGCGPLPGGSLSAVAGSYEAQDASRDNLTLWYGYDTSTFGRRLRTMVKLLVGPTGAKHRAGIVINRRDHTALPGTRVHFLAELDFESQLLRLLRYDGSRYIVLGTVNAPGLQLEEWYRLDATVTPSPLSGEVYLTASATGGPLSVTLGPVGVTGFFPSSGLFGLGANRALARFAVFRLEATP